MKTLWKLFAKVVRYGTKYGADLITIETMNDSYETKAALLAAKENSSLPVIVTNAYGEDGLLMTGASPEAMAAMLEGMGADAIGANCSLGPEQLRGVMGKASCLRFRSCCFKAQRRTSKKRRRQDCIRCYAGGVCLEHKRPYGHGGPRRLAAAAAQRRSI